MGADSVHSVPGWALCPCPCAASPQMASSKSCLPADGLPDTSVCSRAQISPPWLLCGGGWGREAVRSQLSGDPVLCLSCPQGGREEFRTLEAPGTLLGRAEPLSSWPGSQMSQPRDRPRREAAGLIPPLPEVTVGWAPPGRGWPELPKQIWFPCNWFGSVTLDSENPQQGDCRLFVLACGGVHWR